MHQLRKFTIYEGGFLWLLAIPLIVKRSNHAVLVECDTFVQWIWDDVKKVRLRGVRCPILFSLLSLWVESLSPGRSVASFLPNYYLIVLCLQAFILLGSKVQRKGFGLSGGQDLQSFIWNCGPWHFNYPSFHLDIPSLPWRDQAVVHWSWVSNPSRFGYRRSFAWLRSPQVAVDIDK